MNNLSLNNEISPEKKIIILDMDGTLYKFQGGSFRNSGLQKKVLENARVYIMNKLAKDESEAEQILQDIIGKYGENISIALEKIYGLDRYDYFNTVWDIDAQGYVSPNPDLKDKLSRIKDQYEIILLSDAPKIWIERVLEFLGVADLLQTNVLSGETDVRKIFGNSYEEILKVLNTKPENFIVFGDQEDTDIIPARKLGMKTVYVNQEKTSSYADYNINTILEIETILN